MRNNQEHPVSRNVRSPDLRGLNSFLDYEPKARAIVVCFEERRRVVSANGKMIEIFPWREFCSELWSGRIYGSGAPDLASAE